MIGVFVKVAGVLEPYPVVDKVRITIVIHIENGAAQGRYHITGGHSQQFESTVSPGSGAGDGS